MDRKEFWDNFFKKGVIRGIGGAFGATIGFAIISTIVIFILNKLGELPLLNRWIANVVVYIQHSLDDY